MKKRSFFSVMMLIAAWLLAMPSFGQIDVPPLSPKAFLKQQVGFTTVEVEYSRPSMRGRVIFGELVPYQEIWRTGANEATTIHFSANVSLQGHEVPAGKYALFTIPGKDNWTIILNKNTRLWGTYGYDNADDLLRFTVPVEALPGHVETFTIDVAELTQSTANIMLMWEATRVKMSLGTDADKKIMAQIEHELRDPMVHIGNTYFSAADYYLTTHRDLEQAMEWIDKAIELNGDKPYYLHLKAKIYAEKGDYRHAINMSNKAIDNARGTDEAPYIEMYEKAIAKWKEMNNM